MTLIAEAITQVRANEPLVVKVRIEDLSQGAKAKFYYRRAGVQGYSSVHFTRIAPEEFQAVVPAYEIPRAPHPYEIEYFFEVADAALRRLAGKGDAFNPLTFSVLSMAEAVSHRADEGAWYRNPWVWVVGGAVAASATAGVVLIATSQRTGNITITIRTQ